VCMTPEGSAESIRALRAEIAERRAQVLALEAELVWLLADAGRRPGDGSDQPALFLADAQERLF
jgi:hypothetical protein